ncbi:MAG: 1-(5-phosphoribosyl)-5-[(5-phosphoribosylamino)methylideneamino]imidazole-4-carboxamide isomerase [Solirubrobacterales bacterium]|nr:1-(5-phosphoribosyl)-5-[(5-phosphoribosylamino)methylideneamino]imidazole-4-carboxamide isomerase [Solirubrobacterales bacterium]
MILFPAVDIRHGHAVRLTQGDYDREQIYNDDPLAAAEVWTSQGATHLHVVDLDGALHGERRNLDHLTRIAMGTGLPVQYGGGLRDIEAVGAAFEAGAWRAVIGTAAFRDRALVEAAVGEFGDRIVVSADARDGRIAAQGWTEATDLAATDAVTELRAVGVKTFVYTDIARDGMLVGTDLEGMRTISAAAGDANVIASGGVGELADLQKLVELDLPNLEGVIAGKALYERRFTLGEAMNTL